MSKILGQGGAQDLSSGEFIASLDIGTSKVRVIVAEVTRENIQIVGVGSASSKGTKKGAITDIDQAIQSIREAVDTCGADGWV